MRSKVFDFIDDARQTLWKDKHEEIMTLVDPKTNKVYEHLVRRVACPICEVDDTSWVFEKEGFDFVKCCHCGLLYVNPQLRPKVAESFYKKSKTAGNWIRVQQGEKEQDWNAVNKYYPALNELQRIKQEGGHLLDIGCSIGQFMKLSEDYGWKAEGVELNSDAAEIARREYGLRVYNEPLKELELDNESYDLITLWGVLEHLPDPGGMLRDVRRLLKYDGLLLLFVPNGHSLVVRITRNHNSTISGRAHLWYFTPQTMGQILEKNGFEKEIEFSVLPQLHEIVHFLQYNTIYKEPKTVCNEEFVLNDEESKLIRDYVNANKLGYKLITIARKQIE